MITIPSVSDSRKTFTVELPYDVKVTCRPLTAASVDAAKRAAVAVVSEAAQVEVAAAQGQAPRLRDPEEDEHDRAAEVDALFRKEIAARHVISWEGIQGDPEVTRDAVRALMDLPVLSEALHTALLTEFLGRLDSKNASAPSPSGT